MNIKLYYTGFIETWNSFKTRPPTLRSRRFYEVRFQPTMRSREATLILGVSATTEKMREAHRRVMVANHPEAGGSHYMASKINEEKYGTSGESKHIAYTL
uniref:J domain-containing protein n=1 Tax=Lactuca sativa TaxID=4236 RepID=A0A9R1XJX5_LACSA|nr:hypothetical protein LSAT_V11C300142420 [Lactuca sativa]